MSVTSGRLVDGTTKVETLGDVPGAQVEYFLDCFGQGFIGNFAGTVGGSQNRYWLSNTDA